MRTTAIAVTAILLAAAGLPAIATSDDDSASAQGPPSPPGHPACLPNDVVDNDDIRIWFQGKTFMLKLFKKNASGEGIDGNYQYKSMEIAELDEDNETVATANLANAQPQSSSCEVEESGDWVNVTYNVTETVQAVGESGSRDDTAEIAFVYHFNRSDDSAKFDLNVKDWPWQGTEDHELAYEFDVTSNWTIEPAENGLGFRDNETGESEAFIEWAPNATASYEDGHEETAIVDAQTSGSDHHTTTQLQFTNASAGYEELDYDPRVAVGPYIIVADILIPLVDLPELLLDPVQELV